MLAHRASHDVPLCYTVENLHGLIQRRLPRLPADADPNRAVERRSAELRRLKRKFGSAVSRPSPRFADKDLQSWMHGGYVPAKQRWCSGLEHDMRAVCSEAGLPPATATSLVSAAARGLISQNPGVVLSRCLSFLDNLTPVLGRRAALAALRLAPSLLKCSPESLRWSAAMLAGLLPEGAVPGAVVRAPMLLVANPMTLWANLDGLQELLGLAQPAALALVLRQPRLLLNSRSALEGRFGELALLAGLPPGCAAVRGLAVKQPSILSYFPRTLELNLEAMARVLGVPFARVQRLVVKQPSLAMVSQESFAAKFAALCAATGVGQADAAAMVLKQPGLLTLSSDSVRAKVAAVSELLLQHRRDGLLSQPAAAAPTAAPLSQLRQQPGSSAGLPAAAVAAVSSAGSHAAPAAARCTAAGERPAPAPGPGASSLIVPPPDAAAASSPPIHQAVPGASAGGGGRTVAPPAAAAASQMALPAAARPRGRARRCLAAAPGDAASSTGGCDGSSSVGPSATDVDALRTALLAAPQLLTLAEANVRDKARLLQECVGHEGVLAGQLRVAPPQLLAQWLCYGRPRFERLRAAAAAAPALPPASLSVLLQSTDTAYDKLLRQWQQQQGGQLQAGVSGPPAREPQPSRQ